jgi:hypothetical protein
MIHKDTFTAEWISSVSAKNGNADKILVEKVCRAFAVLEGLSEAGFDFVFKGGTALMLLTGSKKRLSTDIDIIVPEHTDLAEKLGKAAASKGFIRMEGQERKQRSDIDKAHFKFFYEPAYKTAQDTDYIMLDVLFEKPLYRFINKVKIDSPFIKSAGDVAEVNVPGFEDLLGDKLTAFAPNTTGIPYTKGENSTTMEILKQLYDIGTLFDLVNDADTIRTTFREFARTETRYRNLSIGNAEILEDVYQTALCIATRGQDGKGDFAALLEGITKVRSYIFSENYHIERALFDTAKAAYLSRIIGSDKKTIEKYVNHEQIADVIIEQPFNTKLNKLKKTHPEAFFYWFQTCELMK